MKDCKGKTIEKGSILKCLTDLRFAEKNCCYIIREWNGNPTLLCIKHKNIPVLLSEYPIKNGCLIDFVKLEVRKNK